MGLMTERRLRGLTLRMQAAVAWLGRSQPEEAVLSGQGVATRVLLEQKGIYLWLSVHPECEPNRVRFTVRNGSSREFDPGDFGPTLDVLAEALGSPSVFAGWTSIGPDKSSPFVSARATVHVHPTLTAACIRYLAGCPVHPRESVFCGCRTWLDRQAALAWPPGWKTNDSLARCRAHHPRLEVVPRC